MRVLVIEIPELDGRLPAVKDVSEIRLIAFDMDGRVEGERPQTRIVHIPLFRFHVASYETSVMLSDGKEYGR